MIVVATVHAGRVRLRVADVLYPTT